MLRIVDDHEYRIIRSWWLNRGVPAVPERSMLPSIGLISYAGDDAIMASFLYIDSEKTAAWAAWTIANRKAKPEHKDMATNEIYSTFAGIVKRQGIKLLFTEAPDKPMFLANLQKLDFTIVDRNMVHLMRVI